jgi:phosphate transport system protein
VIPAAETPHHIQRALLDEQIAEMRARVVEMGDLVAHAVARAVTGLVDRDDALLDEVVTGDAAVNELHRQVREVALAAIVRHQPVARDLREIMGLFQMGSELERMGDHAVSIARIASVVAGVPWPGARNDLVAIAELVGAQVRDIVAAVVAGDVEGAREIAARDDAVDAAHDAAIATLLQLARSDAGNAEPATQVAFAVHCLERVADRVTNIAEELVFVETGAIVDLD